MNECARLRLPAVLAWTALSSAGLAVAAPACSSKSIACVDCADAAEKTDSGAPDGPHDGSEFPDIYI